MVVFVRRRCEVLHSRRAQGGESIVVASRRRYRTIILGAASRRETAALVVVVAARDNVADGRRLRQKVACCCSLLHCRCAIPRCRGTDPLQAPIRLAPNLPMPISPADFTSRLFPKPPTFRFQFQSLCSWAHSSWPDGLSELYIPASAPPVCRPASHIDRAFQCCVLPSPHISKTH